jgi:hypothetical protein
MNRLILLLAFLFISFDSFATASQSSLSFSSVFSDIGSFFSGIWNFITVTVPSAIRDFFVYIGAWIVLMKFVLAIESMQFLNDVAIQFLDLVELNTMINVAVQNLPNDVRSVLVDIGFFEGLTIVIEALMTRLVYKMF